MSEASIKEILLSRARFALLREVLELRRPDLLPVLDARLLVRIETSRLRDLQEVVGDELVTSGLTDSGEPNARGLELEKLIDALSPYRR